MFTREKILKELDIQISIEGNSNNIELLKTFVNKIKYASQWIAFVEIKFHRYGKAYYQCHRLYYPTKELKDIMSN